MRYLKIENRGTFDIDALLLLGVSNTRLSGNDKTIGKFGSGTKQSICLFLRHGLIPIWYVGNLKLEFFTNRKDVKAVNGESNSFNQVCCQVTGKDPQGKQINRVVDLGFVTEFGELDWTDVSMGLREIVSNAIDASFELNNNLDGVVIESVDKSSVRAKAGHTRFFVEYTREVGEFEQNISEKFLVFNYANPYNDMILEKKEEGPARIYRRGVLVGYGDKKSIFDYNLKDVDLDESRNLKGYDGEAACARLMKRAPAKIIASFLTGLSNVTESYFEGDFSASRMELDCWEGEELSKSIKENWSNGFRLAFGQGAVATNNDAFYCDKLRNKGFKPIVFSNSSIIRVLKANGCPTYLEVLDKMEAKGLETFDPLEDTITCFDRAWFIIDECFNMAQGKEKPELRCFSKILDAGAQLQGFYADNTVFINKDIEGSPLLQQVIIEEIAHHVTGSTDCSRDFQDYAFKLSSLMMSYIHKKGAQ